MLDFDWRTPQAGSPDTRYNGKNGEGEWSELLKALRIAQTVEHCWNALDTFLDSCKLPSDPRQTCIFISHQRADQRRAERIACIIDHHQLHAWLDVHDPTLNFVNQNIPAGLIRSILIAAIIEMALINSTHIIAVHTGNSAISRWVPYELARAKSRKIISRQAAGWFRTGNIYARCGEYVHLAADLRDENDIIQWLISEARGISPAVKFSPACGQHNTKKLN
jgi:hypothetical protein